MSKMKRRIVALSTAFAMAFVMIASLVVVVDVNAMPQLITTVNFNVTAPAVGSTIEYGTTPIEASVADGEVGYKLLESRYMYKDQVDALIDGKMMASTGTEVVDDGEYYAQFILVRTSDDYMFEYDASNNRPLSTFAPTINGGEYYGAGWCDENQLMLFVKLTAKADTPQPPVDPSGGDDSGTASSGTDATPAATGDTGTSSVASTTKVTSPKTADVMPFVPVALVVAGATAIGVIAFRRRNS